MKRIVLLLSIPFAFASTCTGMIPGMGEAEKELVIVPVPENDADEDAWCCEYKGDDGNKKHALVKGAAECNETYGGDKEGRWVSGPECIPCCCKTTPAEDAATPTFELTTPLACAAVGECISDGGECKSDERRNGSDRDGKPRRNPPRGPIVKPGAKLPPGH